jgi:hypothetical protein
MTLNILAIANYISFTKYMWNYIKFIFSRFILELSLNWQDEWRDFDLHEHMCQMW